MRVLDTGDAQTQPAGATLQVAAVGDTQTHSASFSPDGSLIVITGGTGARLFHTGSGELFGTLATGVVVNGAAFSKDGQTIALGEQGRVELWSTATRTRREAPLPAGLECAPAAFSSDGRFLLTSGFKRARVWDVATARGASGPLKLQSSVTAAAIGPDGSRFLLAAGPETGIYDTATSTLVFPLPEPSPITQRPLLAGRRRGRDGSGRRRRAGLEHAGRNPALRDSGERRQPHGSVVQSRRLVAPDPRYAG